MKADIKSSAVGDRINVSLLPVIFKKHTDSYTSMLSEYLEHCSVSCECCRLTLTRLSTIQIQTVRTGRIQWLNTSSKQHSTCLTLDVYFTSHLFHCIIYFWGNTDQLFASNGVLHYTVNKNCKVHTFRCDHCKKHHHKTSICAYKLCMHCAQISHYIIVIQETVHSNDITTSATQRVGI